MLKKINFIFLIPALLLIVAGCMENPPSIRDGEGKLRITAYGDTSVVDTVPHYIRLRNAKVILTSEYGTMISYTDNEGILSIESLPSAIYNITFRMVHPLVSNRILVGNIKNIEIASHRVYVDSVFASPVSNTGLAINEIYCGGPINNFFYFYDQYIELYNYSDSLIYLDGMQVSRVSGNNEGKGPGADEGDDGDFDGVTYIFKFPGRPGERNHFIRPGQFIVIAGKAIDHRTSVSTSIDLNSCDWEFYNQYSATDFDNPNVPNLLNIRADRTVDFLINLVSDVIILTSGVDTVWEDGLDISTVIDGVQYASSATKIKTIDSKIDKGLALSPPRYSGQAMRRREPGGDTDDATLDWEIIPTATPGRH
ncbi:MAG: DUF4876 domain-containing protein [Ignavibacteriaceae bacterium]|nr:DUF4876 domain-containing protein [Ignavibacteriaceae bacterium]